MRHRPIVILAVSFAVVLAAGVALAQVGNFAPNSTELAEKSDSAAWDVLSLPQTQDPEAPDVTGDASEKGDLKEHRPVKVEPQKVVGLPGNAIDQPEEPAKEPADTTPPKLTITSPTDGAHFGEKTLKYTGMTEPGARVFAGEWEADVFESGEWHIVLVLSAGKNVTTFTAKDAAGNRTKATVTAYLDVSGEEFTAHQKYGTNSEPWEKFTGTAAPGTVIELISKYGKAKMVTEGSEWYLKLHFEGLTEPASFPIVLETSTGKRMEFTFTYKPKAVDFSAQQKYVTNVEPWEEFSGTAMPGTVIELGSAYGDARLVTEGYEWYLKLHFEGLTGPAGFPIVLHSSTGRAMEFMFTYDPKPIEFTANRTYGSCSEPEPYDKYYGTATPGTTIAVSSAYGSGTTVVGAGGEWAVKVFFTGTTPGEPFVVTASDSEGHAQSFEFVSYAGGGK
ncbi:MAG: hypothetical protein ACXW1Y_01850 [Acidimicrobiia bacterium]